MPKDPKKNVDRFKIRGGDINEFEYDQNQEALTARKPKAKTAAVSSRGASAKKLAARKAAKKK